MCSDPACLGYALILVLVGFAVLIYVLLKYRKKLFKQALLITADQVWANISDRATTSGHTKSDLLFGIWQEATPTEMIMLVRNHENDLVGRVEFPMGQRNWKISIGEERFEIDFPLTWNRTADLRRENSEAILASYSIGSSFGLNGSSFGGRHFDISGYGNLVSERLNFSRLKVANYQLNKILVGTSQEISRVRQTGRLILFASSLPLQVRIFLLVLS
ncbi:hypothetical protein BH10BDE1_BH10BDE1_26290 [soil metagenome]